MLRRALNRAMCTLPKRPKIALVGRTNVGKSTLFNRLTNSRNAIVHDAHGTTRDRRECLGHLGGFEFTVLDTGGLADAPNGTLEEGMLKQTQKAVHEADLIFFLIDGRSGLTVIDQHFSRWLRKENPRAPVHLVANKLEGYPEKWEDEHLQFYELGMGQAIPIAAEHGEGMNMLLDEIIPVATKFEASDEESKEEEETKEPIKFAIVGRPNVGKSTLLNRIIRDERVLTGSMPGVTRDSVEVDWEFSGRRVRLVDTAGIRRASKRDQENQIENLSVRGTERAMATAQVVVVVLDMQEPSLINMDLSIAEKAIDEGRAVVFAANKCDLAKNVSVESARLREQMNSSMAQIRDVPIIPTSALHGDGVRRLMPAILEAYEKWCTRVSTGKLNRWLKSMDRHHPPPTVQGKTLNVKYMTQVKARPPTFAMFVNKPTQVPESYKRFLLKELREEFNMTGVPVRLLLRGGDNPYTKKGSKKIIKRE